ncbi:4Fe-4S binding protein [Archangium lansingense]|uniref:4Fe-4S binding protein n=1 Tax=Archangium lansingense TaxID=2995310 RepID=A0ABT4A250_9BACT|nr:4Fe-4S binding protein [Archangium lansinium]MCY1075671.1 4Fe-4S binding protein [Archangium lansinium]
MSSQTTLSRRAFLGLRRSQEAPTTPVEPAPVSAPAAPEPGFSLEAFYSSRARSGETTGRELPVFSLREGLLTARVRPQQCLAWQGSFCSTCSERCPVEGAITLESGRPHVEEARCNGCGLCVQVCPAPLNALELLSSPQQVPGS